MAFLFSAIRLARWLQQCSAWKYLLLQYFLPCAPVSVREREKEKSSDQRKLEEMPDHLRFNPWILTAYRPANQSTLQCIKSICSLHNETFNIVSHGLPILYVLLNGDQLLPPAEDRLPSYLPYCHLISCLSPWLGSFLYHVFMNHKAGPGLYRRLLQADMAGIWITQTFGALTTLTVSFLTFGDPFRRAFLLLYLATACWALHRGLTAGSAWQRALSFAPLVIMRALALVARLSTRQVVVHSWHLAHVLNQEVLPILGAFISAARIPERFSPGAFDLALNSHNLMHCLVLLGGLHMHFCYLIDIEIIRSGAVPYDA